MWEITEHIQKKSSAIPADYSPEDPLDIQGQKPLVADLHTGWWDLPYDEQKQVVVNALRSTMLSPRLNLKWNTVIYQELMGVPADESNPQVFEALAKIFKERFDPKGQMELGQNPDYIIPFEENIPGKAIYGFIKNLHRLANLGPFADKILKAAHDDLENGGGGHIFRNELLAMDIPGVDTKVASFAWLMLNPENSDLATIDVWMMRHLDEPGESPKNRNHYYQLENKLRQEKDSLGYHNVPLGQYQWAAWDKIRTPGFHQDHSGLRPHNPVPYQSIDFPATQQEAWSNRWRSTPEQVPGQEALFASVTDWKEAEPSEWSLF